MAMTALEMAKEARKELNSTQINWQEDCLFLCDDLLDGLIQLLEMQEKRPEVKGLEYIRLEDESCDPVPVVFVDRQ